MGLNSSTSSLFYFDMSHWLKRLLIAVLLVVWLLIMLFPCMAFSLAMRTELQLGSNPNNHVRLFLVSEELGEGIGVEWKRPFSSTNAQCTQTAVNYIMWVGEGEDVVFCQCTDTATGEQLPSLPFACQKGETP